MKACFQIILMTGFLLVTGVAYAQKQIGSVLLGRVVDIENRAVSSINIELKKDKRKTVTDRKGMFQIAGLQVPGDTMMVYGAGFETLLLPVGGSGTDTIDTGDIQIAYSYKQLPGVEITGRLKRSYKSDYSYAATKTQTAIKDIPQAVSTITKELIKDKMQFHLNQALTSASGVNLYSGNDEYTIRGFRAENAHLSNGLRQYNSPLVSPMLVNIERIEVIKGPTSALYGNADPGGNINLVTKKPLSDQQYSFNVWGGSYNTVRAQADLTGPLSKSKKLLYRLNGGYENAGSFRKNHFNKSFQVAPSFSFIANDKIQLNADFSVQHTSTIADRGQPGQLDNNNLLNTPLSFTITQPGDYLKETDIAGILSLSYKINNHISFNSAVQRYITDQKLGGHGIKGYISPDSVNLYYTSRTFSTFTTSVSNYANFEFQTGKLSHQFIVGHDFIKSDVNINTFNGELPGQFGRGSGIVGTFSLLRPVYSKINVKDYEETDTENFDPNAEEYQTQGVYFQERITFRKWQLLAGLRRESYEGDDDADSSGQGASVNVLLPRIGIVYTASKNLNLYATFNKGFDPSEIALVRQVFDEPLKPLYSELLEAGIKADILHNSLSASIALYRLRIKNIATSANDLSRPDLFIQRGEDQSTGVEGELNGNISPNFSIAFSMAYNVAKIRKSNVAGEINTVRENAPRISGSGWLKYSFNKGFLKGYTLSGGPMGQTGVSTLTRGLTLPGFLIMQAGVGYTYKRIQVAANINNMFNKKYWVGGYNYVSKWPGMPRNLMLSLGYQY